jgi:hypothetical protein
VQLEKQELKVETGAKQEQGLGLGLGLRRRQRDKETRAPAALALGHGRPAASSPSTPARPARAQAYERAAIAAWLDRSATSPLTGAQLESRRLIPCVALRQLIASFAERASE